MNSIYPDILRVNSRDTSAATSNKNLSYEFVSLENMGSGVCTREVRDHYHGSNHCVTESHYHGSTTVLLSPITMVLTTVLLSPITMVLPLCY